MKEIARFRKRISNSSATSTEFRMTISEARNLLSEIENLIKSKTIEQEPKETPEQEIVVRTLDCGNF